MGSVQKTYEGVTTNGNYYAEYLIEAAGDELHMRCGHPGVSSLLEEGIEKC